MASESLPLIAETKSLVKEAPSLLLPHLRLHSVISKPPPINPNLAVLSTQDIFITSSLILFVNSILIIWDLNGYKWDNTHTHTYIHTHTHTHIYIYICTKFLNFKGSKYRWQSWCFGYRSIKWTQWPVFECWLRFFAFQVPLITSEKIGIQVSSPIN